MVTIKRTGFDWRTLAVFAGALIAIPYLYRRYMQADDLQDEVAREAKRVIGGRNVDDLVSMDEMHTQTASADPYLPH